MPIKFVPKKDLIDCEIELEFTSLGIDNVFIYMTKYMQVYKNCLLFLNKKKKVLGKISFESEERTINFFNFAAPIIGYKIIFKDKFAIKKG